MTSKTNTIHILDLPEFKMCMAACADLQAFRAYLTGVYLEPRKGLVTGTNGYILVQAKCIEEVDLDPVIIRLERKTKKGETVLASVHKSADSAQIDMEAGLFLSYRNSKQLQNLRAETLHWEYPDVSHLVAAFSVGSVPKALPQFNPLLLGQVLEAYDRCYPTVRISQPEKYDPYYVDLRESSAKIILMGCDW